VDIVYLKKPQPLTHGSGFSGPAFENIGVRAESLGLNRTQAPGPARSGGYSIDTELI